MTNKEIETFKQELYEILKNDALPTKQWERLRDLAIKINAPKTDSINAITQNIHNTLQTEMMFNACASAEESCKLAKRSCFWAAVAAIVACISVIITSIIALLR